MAGSGAAHLRDGALLSVDGLVVGYPTRAGTVSAVAGVSFDLMAGETLGLVGESGCGKSTTGRAIAGHVALTAGTIRLDGADVTGLRGETRRGLRRRVQMIFQDPISSLNPRRTVEDIVGEGLRIWKVGDRSTRRTRVREMMEAVGLRFAPSEGRRPDQFSGGQCQRISIARALILDPQIIVCDEPVSALDVSVQAQVLNLLADMKERYSLTLLFISHDLAVVKHVSDRVAVMYLGKMCEVAPSNDLYVGRRHPYTLTLLASIPGQRSRIDARQRESEPPSPIDPPSGCRFRTRCPYAQERCALEEPLMREIGPGHYVACHFPLDPALR